MVGMQSFLPVFQTNMQNKNGRKYIQVDLIARKIQEKLTVVLLPNPQDSYHNFLKIPSL